MSYDKYGNFADPQSAINRLIFPGFVKRLIANLLDGGICVVVGLAILHPSENIISAFILNYLNMALGFIQAYIPINFSVPNEFWVVAFLIYYWPLREASPSRATFGKGLMGIIIVNRDKTNISLSKAVLRNIIKLVSIGSGIGILMMLFDKKKQTLHDRICKTYVIRGK